MLFLQMTHEDDSVWLFISIELLNAQVKRGLEGNGNPPQCSCLENPRDRGAWWAAVYGVTESDTTEATQQQQQRSAGWVPLCRCRTEPWEVRPCCQVSSWDGQHPGPLPTSHPPPAHTLWHCPGPSAVVLKPVMKMLLCTMKSCQDRVPKVEHPSLLHLLCLESPPDEWHREQWWKDACEHNAWPQRLDNLEPELWKEDIYALNTFRRKMTRHFYWISGGSRNRRYRENRSKRQRQTEFNYLVKWSRSIVSDSLRLHGL